MKNEDNHISIETFYSRLYIYVVLNPDDQKFTACNVDSEGISEIIREIGGYKRAGYRRNL